jgi:hypothetical protein
MTTQGHAIDCGNEKTILSFGEIIVHENLVQEEIQEEISHEVLIH